MISQQWQRCGEAQRNEQSLQETATTDLLLDTTTLNVTYLPQQITKKVTMTLFENLDVELVDGHHVLGSVLGYSSAWEKFKVEEATEFSTLLNKLASHGNKRPKM